MQRNNFNFYVICLLLLLFILGGCYTTNKANKQVDKALQRYPIEMGEKFRAKYPCTTIRIDTAWMLHDTIIEVPCPEVPIIVDTLRFRDTVIRNYRTTVPVRVQLPTRVLTKTVEDSSKLHERTIQLSACSDTVKQLQSDLSDMEDSRNKWCKWCIITWVLIAGFVTFKLLK